MERIDIFFIFVTLGLVFTKWGRPDEGIQDLYAPMPTGGINRGGGERAAWVFIIGCIALLGKS